MFQRFFMYHRLKTSLSLITQDVSLMVDILELQTSNSVQGIKLINVWEIQNEKLTNIDLQDAKSRLIRQIRRKQIDTFYNIEPSPEALLPRLEITIGSKLNYIRGHCYLEKELGAGGEGKVYTTSISGIVAKIYKSEKLTKGL
ncbi:hypothetical protein [Fischerella muscicola]|nr:hypothetical protein [Fischerella muscicola]